LSEFAKNAQVIHVDIDPSSIGKLVNIDYPIVGDLKDVLTKMIPLIKDSIAPDSFNEWIETVSEFEKLNPLSFEDSDEVLKPQWVIKRVGELLGDKAIITTDVGQHQMWTAQFYPFTYPRQFITSGGLGTMGFGFPAAMGAKRAFKDKVVINFTGDGSILMNIQELVTSVEKNIPVINIILNNAYLGMVRQWQTFFFDKRYAETDLSYQPDFVALAESCGAKGYKVTTKDEFDKALEDAIKSDKVTLMNVIVDRLENVLPMVPAGGTLYNMMLEFKD
jgi:acetolactate synthase-1/2/3 large subunit